MAVLLIYNAATVPAADSNGMLAYSLSTDTEKIHYSRSPGGAIRVLGNFPNVDATHDLGSSTYKWRDGYFSRNVTLGGSLIVGNGLTVSAGGLAVTGNTAIGGTLTASGNIATSNSSGGQAGVITLQAIVASTYGGLLNLTDTGLIISNNSSIRTIELAPNSVSRVIVSNTGVEFRGALTATAASLAMSALIVPVCSLYQQNLPPARGVGVGVAITWDSEAQDAANLHSGGSSRITIATAGRYRFAWSLILSAASTTVLDLALQKNGVTRWHTANFTSAGSYGGAASSVTVDCAPGDYFELIVVAPAVTLVNGADNSWFEAVQVA